jgi:hypothetical protein
MALVDLTFKQRQAAAGEAVQPQEHKACQTAIGFLVSCTLLFIVFAQGLGEWVTTQAGLQRLGKLRLERACVTRGRCPWAPRPLPEKRAARFH